MKKTNIELINHASVLISHGKTSILSDPWYMGSVFHNGWRLIHEFDNNKISGILSRTSHIYISHEHPDHFSTNFFLNKENQKIIKNNNIKIIFQHTKDKRIINFLKKLGLSVKEFYEDEKVKLGSSVEIQIVKHDFIDSSLIIKTPNLKILNLNDCPLRDESEIKKFKKKHGSFDLLLTQFSYAAWKGGIERKDYREKASMEKLKTIKNQATILNCKSIIPFASFVYFSNELNFYMNDSINTPDKVKNFFSSSNLNIIFLYPGEIQECQKLRQNVLSLDSWRKNYKEINNNKKDQFNESIYIDNLKEAFISYRKKIFKKNSKFLIYILSKTKILNFFQPIKINLYDHKKVYIYSIFDGLSEYKNFEFDISMHSQSLFFIFKNEFGFDTLTVNGCFDASIDGFSKSTKSLAIGSLNALGLGLNLKLFKEIKIIFIFLKKLNFFFRNMKKIT